MLLVLFHIMVSIIDLCMAMLAFMLLNRVNALKATLITSVQIIEDFIIKEPLLLFVI